jgi:NTP pyrophosphatase (non-canonical NTP hydrolase)
MGYMTDGLTFNTLRSANINRLPTFKNSKGEPAHSELDGSDWSPAQWYQAFSGEAGEYANIRKKFERGDIDEATFKYLAAKELADIQIYLDLLAFRLGIDLGQAVVSKFNEVSLRVESSVFIKEDGSDYYFNTTPQQ